MDDVTLCTLYTKISCTLGIRKTEPTKNWINMTREEARSFVDMEN